MTLAYCADPVHRQFLAGIHPAPIIASTWEDFQHQAHSAGRMVIVVEHLERWPHWEELVQLRLHCPRVALLLATACTPESARVLGALRIDSVVWLHEASSFPRAMAQLHGSGPRSQVVNAVAYLESLDPYQRDFLRALFTAEDPPHTEREWAGLVYRSASALTYHLSERPAHTRIPVAFALNVNLLFMAFEYASHPRGWRDLAIAVDVDERRLRRVVARLLGREHVGRDLPDPQALVGAFLRVLDGETPPDPVQLPI